MGCIRVEKASLLQEVGRFGPVGNIRSSQPYCALITDPRYWVRTRLRAISQPATLQSLSGLSICGAKDLSNCQLLAKPAWSGHMPALDPANQAAPKAVVSAMTGRSTWACKMSARRCMVQSLATIPPSTLSTVVAESPQSACMAFNRSRV